MTASTELMLVWPKDWGRPNYKESVGYAVSPLDPADDASWVTIHRLAIPAFSASDLRRWLARYRTLALPDGILVAREQGSGEPVATAGSLADSSGGMVPLGGQLGWVATVPAQRGRGLATWLCGLATDRLLAEGFQHLFVSTGDDMLPAVRVYLQLGYVPCLYAPEQRARWEAIAHSIPQCQDQRTWVTWPGCMD